MSLDLILCMKSFAAVVYYQSFSNAARNIHLSTSVLTKQIQRLEKDLGKKLFHRTTRSVSLTEAGKIYFEHVKKILENLQAAEEAMGNLDTEPHGTISVFVPSTLNSLFFAKSLEKFLRAYPKISCHLTGTYSISLVHTGEVDLFITAEKFHDKSLVQEFLYSGPTGIFAAPSYIEKHGMPKTLNDLKHHNCLVSSHLFPDNKWTFANGKRIAVQGNFRSELGINILFGALNGIGLFLSLKVLVADELRSGRLVEVPLDADPVKWCIHLYHRPAPQGSNVKLLAEHLVKDMAQAGLEYTSAN